MSPGSRPADEPQLVGKDSDYGVAAPRTSRDYKSELDGRAQEEALKQQVDGSRGLVMDTVSQLMQQASQVLPEQGKKLLGLESSTQNQQQQRQEADVGPTSQTEDIPVAAVEAFLRDVHRSEMNNHRSRKKK